VLTLDNSTGYLTNRLSKNNVTLYGGTFNYIVSPTTASNETAGILTLGAGGGTSTVNMGGSNALANTLTFASLSATGVGSTLNFTGNLGTASNKILFTTAPTLIPAGTSGNGLIQRATVTNGSNFDFATYNTSTGITAFTAYNQSTTSDINAALATDT